MPLTIEQRKQLLLVRAAAWEQQDLVAFLKDLLDGEQGELIMEYCEHLMMLDETDPIKPKPEETK